MTEIFLFEIKEIFYILFGAIIAFSSTYILEWNKKREEVKNIAKALYIEITLNEKSIAGLNNLIKSQSNPNSIITIPQILYPDNGLYFAFQDKISLFEKNISEALYTFYQKLVNAENERRLILRQNELANKNILTEKEDIRIASTKRMLLSVKESSEMIDEIKSMLKKYYA